MYTDNRRKDILVFGECQADVLNHITIPAGAKYSINMTKSRKKICLSVHYNGSNSLL